MPLLWSKKLYAFFKMNLKWHTLLLAPEQSGENPVLGPGEYSFPFQFHMPSDNLPTSVEGNFGHVRYWLKAFIDRPWRFDITTKSVFTVIERVDINLTPGLLVSVSLWLNDQQIFCCLKFHSTVHKNTVQVLIKTLQSLRVTSM